MKIFNECRSLTRVGELNPYWRTSINVEVNGGGTFIFPTTLIDRPSQVKQGVGETGCLRVVFHGRVNRCRGAGKYLRMPWTNTTMTSVHQVAGRVKSLARPFWRFAHHCRLQFVWVMKNTITSQNAGWSRSIPWLSPEILTNTHAN